MAVRRGTGRNGHASQRTLAVGQSDLYSLILSRRIIAIPRTTNNLEGHSNLASAVSDRQRARLRFDIVVSSYISAISIFNDRTTSKFAIISTRSSTRCSIGQSTFIGMTRHKVRGGGNIGNRLLLTSPCQTVRLAGKGNISFRDRKGCRTILAILVTRLVFVLTSYSNFILVIANIGTGLDLCTISTPRTSSFSCWNRVRANRCSFVVLNFIGQINKLIVYTVHGNKTSNDFANLILNVKARSIVNLCIGVRITPLRQLHRHRHLRILKRNDWFLILYLTSLNISPGIGRLGTTVVGTADGKLNDELLATRCSTIKTTPVFREVETGNGD